MITTGLLDLHSAIRYAAFFMLLVNVVLALYKLSGKHVFTDGFRKLSRATILFLNIQFLTGIALYILKGYYAIWANLSAASGMFAFFGLYHLIGMFIAVSLVNMGYQTSIKLKTDHARIQRIAISYSFGFLLIFLLIPWPFFHSWATWF